MTKEERFFNLIKEAASAKKCVFFMDCGEGRELIDDLYDGEDLSGWLIPEERAGEFLGVRKKDQEWENDCWMEFFCYAEWSKDEKGKVEIHFMKYE